MPGYADDWYWVDLPESARIAAGVMGYTQQTWDTAEKVSYHSKKFEDLLMDEKRAAVYLGRNPLDFKLKGVAWEDLEEVTRKHALVLGWDEHKWDKSWPVKDVECHTRWWQDLTPQQKEALQYFGYNDNLWDGKGNEEIINGSASASNASREEPQRAQGNNVAEEEDIKVDPVEEVSEETAKKPAKKKTTKPSDFTQSELFGGSRGNDFDHGKRPHIDEITVAADQTSIHGIAVKYFGMNAQQGTMSKKTQTLKLRPGEFITSVKVRATNIVHGLTFFSNRGTKLGPCGGQRGNEVEVPAPPGCVLCGLTGKAGKQINAIGFRWGPNPRK